MDKKILPSIGISALVLIGVLFVILIGYLVFMRIFHPVQGTALQKAYLEAYAGCGKSSYLIGASDEAFADEWKTASTTFDFSAQDVDGEIRNCQERIKENGGAILESYDENGNPVYTDADTMRKIKSYQEKFLRREFSVLK